ncbi:MAG: peptidoglycan DD-metalloendopeptidase family protein [Parvibaculum sp.]|uniref:murein hydrolase activator EnvC family protein n=1 Tax=Parvibaculum sp. TaxID=2024848 RepID=UPI0025E2AFB3|nr:peptidoglycan DD-metalloendopeptidase family protein [Parvibaculum sp.]MCE9648437.1 peptidoglycan DD-metalloendopeptidase family protein [Parvibaculum sp.]
MFRHKRLAALAAVLTLALPPGLHAETADPSKLESLKQELGTSVERKKALEKQTEAARRDAELVRSKLIETAASVQAREAEVSASEARIAELKDAEAALLVQLEGRRAKIADLLAALTRLDRNPPPALAVKPEDALGAIRGAILLGDAVPELRAQADELKARLQQLTRLRESILAERTTLAQASASLARDRADLEKLLARKLARQQRLAQAAESEEARATRLSREATDLTDLIGRLESEAAARLPQSRPAPRPAPVEPAARPSPPRDTETALLTPPDNPPALPSSRLFSQAKGLIRLPATGTLVRGFGVPNGAGGTTEGMTIATRPGAQVIAPFDGKIVFAGPFRRYGQLLIISVGEGYHVLLAGMTKINGSVGQSILAGEPVGTMDLPSPEESAAAERKSATGGRPSLYIEFRKDSDPIDPRPWLMMSDKKARG